MKRLLPCTLMVLLLSAAVEQSEAALIYSEDFNTSAGGWRIGTFGVVDPSIISYQSTGGIGNSGYIRGERNNVHPVFGPTSSPASDNLLGDLNALYGSQIRFSYFGRVFQSAADLAIRNVFFASGTNWRKDLVPASGMAPFRVDWTEVTFVIDTDWTDTEATANGWTQSGTSSWSDTLSNVTFNQFFGGVGASSLGTNITVSTMFW